MSSVSMEKAERTATLFSACIKGMMLYPPAHPSVLQPLEEAASNCADILFKQPEFKIGLVDDTFFFEEHLFTNPSAPVAELTQLVRDRGVPGFTFRKGLSREELGRFFSVIVRKSSGIAANAEELRRAGIEHIVPSGAEDEEEREEERPSALGMYGEALDAVQEVFREIEKGRIPDCRKVIRVVEEMVSTAVMDTPTLLGLSMIKDYDNYTYNHSVNVGILSMALGATLGFGREELKDLGVAGMLHDIGKTRVPKDILNKPGKLTSAELEEIKRHSEYGAGIIKEMEEINPAISDAVLGHHIQYDRKGYPEWGRQRSFGIITDILAVADAYDALTTLRVYQRPYTPKAAIDRLRQLCGSRFDGRMVEKFVEMMGTYPVGTMVRLDSNEVAVVVRPNPEDREFPMVRIIMDAAGELLPEPRMEQLKTGSGECYARIVAVFEPVVKSSDDALRYLA